MSNRSLNLEEKSKDPKWRARWAKRNKDLANYLGLVEKATSDFTEDVGSLWEKDVDEAYEALSKDEKKSLKNEGLFRDQTIDVLYPERK